MGLKLMMVEGRYTGEVDLSNIDTKQLPSVVGLVSTVQFIDYIDQFVKALEKQGITVKVGKKRQIYDTQLLGCDQGAATAQQEVNAYIYFGTGRFHPLGVALKTEKDVHCYDPISAKQTVIPADEAKSMNKKRKNAYLGFLKADTLGILISTKPGQNHFHRAKKLKEQLKGKKTCYLFVQDTLDFNQIENFPFIDCWVNTACNRIMDDMDKFPKPLVDLADLEHEELVTLKI